MKPGDQIKQIRAKDRKEALKRHGEECLKCGSDERVEVHHVYGVERRDPEAHRPLCHWCHLVAPMGDEYWDWEENGKPGWYDLSRKINEIAAYHNLPYDQKINTPFPSYGFERVLNKPERKPRKPRPKKTQPVEYSPSALPEIVAAIQNWRIEELSDVQVAHRLMKWNVVPPAGCKKWSIFAVKTTIQRALAAA